MGAHESRVFCVAVAVGLGAPALGRDVPFAEKFIGGGAADPLWIHAVDIDRDADIDVLSAGRFGKVLLFENNGGKPPSFTSYFVDPSLNDARWVHAADMDKDGDVDVLACSAWVGSNEIAWYENDGNAPPAFTKHVVPSAAIDFFAVHGSDLNRDGAMDIVSVNGPSADTRPSRVAWHMSDGASPPAFVEHVISTSPNRWAYSADVADFDLDGDGDILVVFRGGGGSRPEEVVLYENDGNPMPTFTERVIWTGGSPYNARCGDLDLDGDLDVVLGAYDPTDELVWLENTRGATPRFVERLVPTSYGRVATACFCDVDRDGRPDIVTSQYDSDFVNVTWFENLGGSPPTFNQRLVAQHDRGTYGSAFGLVTTDLDLDTDSDIVVAYRNAGGDGELHWMEQGFCAADVDGDGAITFSDLLIVLSDWGPCP